MQFFFFDLDGTLEDSSEDMINSVHGVRNFLNLPKKLSSDVRLFVNKGMTELYLNCFDDYIENRDINSSQFNQVKELYEKYYFENICINTRLYDGITDVLKYLSLNKENKIFIITNKPEKHSRELIRKLGVDKFFTDLMGGDSCSEMKPSSLPLKVIAEKYHFNFKSDKAFMIGDSEGDIKCGKNFGATTIWCGWGYNQTSGKEIPHLTAQQPKDLLSFI
ncbi:HAD family hydrolase [Pigmentibacter sp. JX0631]|uniref:HAD family hydrolase n=1 Tax=Pigmentibacter sp. JX0631 TaxID=2976982 RepID=UPI0024683E62|nr:HAD family hydrolase [Pigmentibacter sp. JX0631]WGL61318.1 HAD family hydrolase [Pigmentibacter sp. JX0631]